MISAYHTKYFAYELTRRCPPDSVEKLAGALVDAQVDLNPHQVDAALFAFNSPLSKGARRAATTALTLEEKLAGQKQIKALEAQRNQKRRSLFDAQDQVDKQREELIAVIEDKLNQTTSMQPLFTLRWAFS